MSESPHTCQCRCVVHVAEHCHNGGQEANIRTWNHTRKGPITGIVTWENQEWIDIELVGDQQLRWYSEAYRSRHDSCGSVVRVRKTFLREVPAQAETNRNAS